MCAMKFLSNWLRIKKFTLRNFTLAERDSSEKKVTNEKDTMLKTLDFSPESSKSHVFVWFYYILGISLKILKSHHHRTKNLQMKNHLMKNIFLLVKKCFQNYLCATFALLDHSGGGDGARCSSLDFRKNDHLLILSLFKRLTFRFQLRGH